MNRTSFALFVALLIHLLLVALFLILDNIIPKLSPLEEKEENKIKISLKELPLKKKTSGIKKEKVKQTTIAPPMPKGSQLKKLTKKTPKKAKLNSKPKPHKPKATQKVEPLPSKKPFIPLIDKEIKKTSAKKDKTLFDILSEDKSEQESKQQKKQTNAGSNINSNITELYGNEFGKLSAGQQKYILDNQEIMRRITQQVLTRVARVNLKTDLNVNRSNIIEFYLHPNGDMTDFRFLQKSGYYTLDDITKETIEYAYSKYPRPSEKTLIRYNVYYNLARY